MSHLVSVVIPSGLRDKARRRGINISAVCRKAIAEEVLKYDESGAIARQDPAPNTAPMQEGIHASDG